jgi:exopolysaccharide biosynthesis WecB/TagA/CpsF family protein
MTKQSFSSIRISDDIRVLMGSSEPVTAFNLVGLSLLSNAQLISENYVYWVDGVMGTFACYLAGLNIRRKPGRDLLTGLLKYIRTTVPNRPVVVIGADYITEQINEMLDREVIQLDLPWVTSIEVAQKIRFDNLTPDHIVILAVGSPKQEWVAASIYKTTGAKCFCFGGAVNMLEGRESIAPFWVQRAGIEWIFRMISDPKSRALRLLTSLPKGLHNLKYYNRIKQLP